MGFGHQRVEGAYVITLFNRLLFSAASLKSTSHRDIHELQPAISGKVAIWFSHLVQPSSPFTLPCLTPEAGVVLAHYSTQMNRLTLNRLELLKGFAFSGVRYGEGRQGSIKMTLSPV